MRDCLRMLLKRGCVRQTGATADGAPLYLNLAQCPPFTGEVNRP